MKMTSTEGMAGTSSSVSASLLLRLTLLLSLLGVFGACSGEVDGTGTPGPLGTGGGAPAATAMGGRAASGGGSGGLGALTCAPPQMVCGGSCINSQTDNQNCGACGRACTGGQSCVAGICRLAGESCGGGLFACASTCVDLQTDEANCGGCGKPCSGGRECSAGACQCPAGTMDCGGACVNLETDAKHCGTCNMACAEGLACQARSCVCAPGRTLCDGACVDLQSDKDHCGTCTKACAGTSVCTAGACTCPTGQALCGDSCADLQTSQQHCGACNEGCGLGQTCTAGACSSGAGGPLLEDGCQGLAQGVTLRQIALYQTVKIPIMDKGQAVAGDARNADVVAGRAGLMRVFVDVAGGFAARSLSARLFIDNGGTVKTYFSDEKPTIRGNSQEEALDSTFQIELPKDAIAPGARYSVEIAECGGAASGGMQAPRFPATEGADLGAIATGVLKVHLVPVRVNSMVPDTNEAALAVYRDLLLASYPITDIQFTVGMPLEAASLNWPTVLDSVRARRSSDKPTADVYYYGLVRPAATLREYCQRACTTGIGYVPQGSGTQQAGQRAAVGIGFGDRVSSETMAHEIGHNHGRGHVDCGGPDAPDPNYPYDNGEVGVYGFDIRQGAITTPTRTDIMGYCENKWFSDYTYQALINRLRTVNGVQAVYVDPASLSRFLVLLLDGDGPRWGHPIDEPSLPAGEPEQAAVLDAQGNAIASVTVYRTEIADVSAWSFEVPLPESGWHALQVDGAPALAFAKHTP